jgi:hypothetical protein
MMREHGIVGNGRKLRVRRGRIWASLCTVGGALVSALVLQPHARADEVILKNGKIIEGAVRESGSRVFIRPWDSDATIAIDRSQIETILPREAPRTTETSTAPHEAAEPALNSPIREMANPRLSGPSADRPAGPAIPKVNFSIEPPLSPQSRAALEDGVPRILTFMVSELGFEFEVESIDLNIEVFDDFGQFEAYKSENSDLHYEVEGYYAVEEDRILVWKNQFDQKLLATIYHEGTHAILRRKLDFVPRWIDEGLAEFFEGLRIHGSNSVVLGPEFNDGWSKRFLYENRIIPLNEFLRMTNHQWLELDEQTRHLPRIMAWSLVAFLMETDEGRQVLRRYVETLKRVPTTDALALAYQELNSAYPGGVARLERQWRAWITGKRTALRL